MIYAFDIETIPNTQMEALLPEPKIDSRLKDPAKIESAKKDGRAKQVDLMALDALTARVCCYSFVTSQAKDGVLEDVDKTEIIPEISDAAEQALLENILKILAKKDTRIVTWNGIGFDLPMIYKRCMILDVDPAQFGAPPLTAWTQRYKTDRHFDLMQIWSNWSSRDFAKLDTVASMVMGERKDDIDVTKIAEMLTTEDGRQTVADYCLQDTRLTLRLFRRFSGYLFA